MICAVLWSILLFGNLWETVAWSVSKMEDAASSDVIGQASNSGSGLSKLRICTFKLRIRTYQTPDPNFQTPDPDFQNSGSAFKTPEPDFQTPDGQNLG